MIQRLLLIILIICGFNTNAAIIYVKNGSAGNGTSWQQAYGSLNLALQNAISGDEIWVAQGTYFPSSTLNATESFNFKDGVKLYGGFLGNETFLTSRADTSGTTTILSGILSSSVQTATLFKINNASNINNLIDGFTISGAKRIMSNGGIGGAGLQILNSTIKLKNCIIKENRTELVNYTPALSSKAGGAAIHSSSSNLILENVNIINNSLDNIKTINNGGIGIVEGGAVYASGGSFEYHKGRIENNEYTYEGIKGYGGAAYFKSVNSISLKNLFVYHNKVSMKNISTLSASNPEGGAFYFSSCSNILMDTNIFHGNYASYLTMPQNSSTPINSYGIASAVYFSSSSGTFNNITFGRNSLPEHMHNSGNAASGIYSSGIGNLSYNNCVFLEGVTGASVGTSIYNYNRCVSKYGIGYANDPNVRIIEMEFVNAIEGNYTPLYCSEHLNFGDSTHVSSTVDINGQPRVVGSSSDPGAVELQNLGTYNRVYVNQANTNAVKEGTSWNTAFSTLQEALNCKCTDSLNNVTMPAEIWVAEGTYRTGKKAEDSFFLNNGQKVYGGFKSGDTQLIQRDSTLLTQQTILSGKYETGKHAMHVVSSLFTYIDTELNSFIVQDGQSLSNANNGGHENNAGAGIYVRGQATLKNLLIRNNKADGHHDPSGFSPITYWGGGIFVYRADGHGSYTFPIVEAGVHVENTKIANNTSGGKGAGLAFWQNSVGSNPVNNLVSKFKNVEISGNKSIRTDGHAATAGGVFVDGRFNIDFEDFTISNNEAAGRSAIEISNNGGSTINFKRGKIDGNKEVVKQGWNNYAVQSYSNPNSIPNIVNFESVVFSNNTTSRTTMAIWEGNLNITNCTFVNNIGGQNQDVNFKDGNFLTLDKNGVVTIKNSIIDYSNNSLPDVFAGSWATNYSVSVENSLFTKSIPTQMVNLGNNLSNTNPLFVNKTNGNYNLQPNSPAIDAGNNSFLTLSPNLDAVSNNRIYNSIVDLGALEYQGTVSITEQTKNKQFVLYPNPAEREVFLQFDEYQKGNVVIYNLQGKKVLEINRTEVNTGKPIKINVENLQSATYIVKWLGDQFEASVKLIKK
ncbi:Por secretion system C-terminal sorting domain-containing protein [Paenimyroides ummariense]|uniref:Por secretion system C-terminal sorting domain-containing protein n=1 Tax=Paenimyroides ummariense TaxID=913024 RepID=A0A1I5CA06_9FLAO|nr:choice-of-anchor Q domain-containing protein [Paenimyroides ummariense]SFN83797.1 Por secretion system C-terminal sorting domain-containing protein [Paenimyroides ummariense]